MAADEAAAAVETRPAIDVAQEVLYRDRKPATFASEVEVRSQKSEVRGQRPEGACNATISDPLLRRLTAVSTSDLCPKITDFGLAQPLEVARR